ncbi:monocarboxylate transporter 9-like [Ylistrum balloti]|uniref:monocarboxylate transporter 9-like n=1 Tax=Ylistrum balloti TaxID=509963 RepID=UPI002905C483|nr:monocarboxylate transporter 9-like [Ylistrum balloti]
MDRGWAWIILLGNDVKLFIIVGTIKSFGLFFIEFLEIFDASVSMTSMIVGLMQITYSVFSLPIMAIGLHHISPRQSILCGGLIGTLAYALGSQAPNIYFLLFTHGVLFGIGFGCVHGPSMYIVGQYFEKRRSLANACMTAGGSVGGLVLPPIFEFLVETYGLRGALLLTSAIISHTLVGAMFLRPPEYIETNEEDSYSLNGNTDDKLTTDNLVDSNIPSSGKEPFGSAATKLTKNNNEICNQETEFETSQNPIRVVSISNDNKSVSHYENFTEWEYTERKLNREYSKDTYICTEDVPPLHSESNTILKTSHALKKKSLYSSAASHVDLSTISLTDISQMQACDDFSEHKSNEGINEPDVKKRSCWSIIHIDISLMKNPTMTIFLVVYCLGSIGSAYGHIYIAALARDVGLSAAQITKLVSTLSGCDVVGRFLCGTVVDRGWMTSSRVVCLTVLITGAMMQLSQIYRSFWSMLLYSIIHGLFAGGIFALTPDLLIDFLGFENFRSALGIAMFSQGFVLVSSAPFIGFLRDRSQTYASSFHFMGTGMILAGLLLFLKPLILRLICKPKSTDET